LKDEWRQDPARLKKRKSQKEGTCIEELLLRKPVVVHVTRSVAYRKMMLASAALFMVEKKLLLGPADMPRDSDARTRDVNKNCMKRQV
jgi:hypothetical protein